MPIKLPNGTYRVQIRKAGFPKIDEVFNSFKAAEAFENLEREKSSFGPKVLRPKMLLSEAVEHYQQSLNFRKKKENTQKTERSRIKRAVEALGAYSLENLADGQRLMLFFDTLGDEKLRILEKKSDGTLAPKENAVRRDGDPDGTLRNESIRLEIAAVSALMNWAVKMKILPDNPIKRITRPSDLSRRRRMARDEELGVLTIAASVQHGSDQRGQDARFVGLMRELGCRPFELCSLLRVDVDIDNRAVRFRDTKNGTDRTVHAVQGAVDLLSIQMLYAQMVDGASPFVFTSYAKASNQPVAFRYRSAVDRLRAAGIVEPDFIATACRREYISAAFDHGLAHEDIRKQSGHKSIKALEIYNVSAALHPDARARLDAEAHRRSRERLEDIAEVLGVSMEDLKELAAKKAKESLQSSRMRATKARESLLGLTNQTRDEKGSGESPPGKKKGSAVKVEGPGKGGKGGGASKGARPVVGVGSGALRTVLRAKVTPLVRAAPPAPGVSAKSPRRSRT